MKKLISRMSDFHRNTDGLQLTGNYQIDRNLSNKPISNQPKHKAILSSAGLAKMHASRVISLTAYCN